MARIWLHTKRLGRRLGSPFRDQRWRQGCEACIFLKE